MHEIDLGDPNVVRETDSGGPSNGHSPPKSAFTGYAVESNCLIVELRRSRQNLFAARILHTLHPAGDSFRIALKKVLLLNNDEAIDNLTLVSCESRNARYDATG